MTPDREEHPKLEHERQLTTEELVREITERAKRNAKKRRRHEA